MRPVHTQRAQQVAHQGGFARAQVAVQGDEGVGQRGLRCQPLGQAAVSSPPPGGGQGSAGGFLQSGRYVVQQSMGSSAQEWARELGFPKSAWQVSGFVVRRNRD